VALLVTKSTAPRIYYLALNRYCVTTEELSLGWK